MRLGCQVTVNVPSGVEPREIYLSQKVDDKAPILKVMVSDVSIETLRVRGVARASPWSTAGPTIDVMIRNTRIRKGLLASLVRGGLRCDECQLYAATEVAAISQKGSIMIDATIVDRVGGSQVDINIRQPNNYVCIVAEAIAGNASQPAVRAPISIKPSSDPWKECNAEQAVKFYDEDKDSFVNRKELLKGLGELPICCGASSCPFSSSCDPLSKQLFANIASNSMLSGDAFAAKIRAMNLTQAVPRCAPTYRVQQAAPGSVQEKLLQLLPSPAASAQSTELLALEPTATRRLLADSSADVSR